MNNQHTTNYESIEVLDNSNPSRIGSLPTDNQSALHSGEAPSSTNDAPPEDNPPMNNQLQVPDVVKYKDGASFRQPNWYRNILSDAIQHDKIVEKVPDQFQEGDIYMVAAEIEGSLLEAYTGGQLRDQLNDGRVWSQISTPRNILGLEILYLREHQGSYLKRIYKQGQGNNHNVLLVHYDKTKISKVITEVKDLMMVEIKKVDRANIQRLDDMKQMLLGSMRRMENMEANLMQAIKQLEPGKPNHQHGVEKTKSLSVEDFKRLEGFNPKVVEIISELVDVEADGHCGYHALASALGMDPKWGWATVRQDMATELREHEENYKELLGDLYDSMLKEIEYFKPKCDSTYYFKLPSMAFVAASCYQCLLVVLTANESFTYLPVRGSPREIRVVAIAMFGDHFMRVTLNPQSAIPPNSPWHAAPEWKKVDLPRLLNAECVISFGKNRHEGSPVDVDE